MTARGEPSARRKRRKSRRRADNDHDDATELTDQLGYWHAVRWRHQRWLALGATLSVLGLALVGSRESNVGAVVVLAGLITLVFSIHRYGRLGEER